jgi:hypothetical protein
MGIFLSLILVIQGTLSTVVDSVQLSRKDKFAPWASLLFPGTGELMRGYKVKGELLLWADGLSIAGVAGFSLDALEKNNAAVGMAAINAGANPKNRSHSYLSAMEGYMSSDDYNLALAIEAREQYPDDLQKQKEYVDARKFSKEDVWLWGSDSLRIEYFKERTSVRRSQQTAQILAGVMVITRIFSVFDVSFFSPRKESDFGLVPVPNLERPGVSFVYRF